MYDPNGREFQEPITKILDNLYRVDDVDATRLHRGLTITAKRRFDAIIFNNPHILIPRNRPQTGLLTRNLIQDFVGSGRHILEPGGMIQVNATNQLTTQHDSVRHFLNTATIRQRFGKSEYFAPFIPHYTDGRPFRYYDQSPFLARDLWSYEWYR